MTADPFDYIFVEDQVGGDRRRSRRHVTITDGDWRPVGDAAAPGGVDGRLQAEIVVNKIGLIVELQAAELIEHVLSGAGCGRRALPGVRVRGRDYRLVAVFAADS